MGDNDELRAIQRRLRNFIVENFLFGEDNGKIGPTTSFLEAGVIDSMGILELIEFVESEYRIAVADEDLDPDNLDSLERLARFVKLKRDGETTSVAT